MDQVRLRKPFGNGLHPARQEADRERDPTKDHYDASNEEDEGIRFLDCNHEASKRKAQAINRWDGRQHHQEDHPYAAIQLNTEEESKFQRGNANEH